MRLHGRRIARIGAQTPAERLYALEQEERRLCARMHRDRVRRTMLGEEITRLRCSLDEIDAAAYRRLVFLKEGRE